MEKMELDLKEYEMKKNSMSKIYQSLQSQASSMLLFTVPWKEMEERLDSIRDETQTRFKELHELDLKVQSKVNELVQLEKLTDEKQKEVTDTRSYLNSLQSMISDLEKVREDKERQMEKRVQELNGVIEEKSNKLNEIVKSMEEKSKLASEEQKKKSVVEVSKTVTLSEELNRKIELKLKDQSLRKKSLEEWSCNLEHKERELQVKEQQLLSKAEELDALNKKSFMEFKKIVKEHDADSQRLQLKEKQLEVKSTETMEKLRQECKKQLEAKERELEVTMEKLHQELLKQLEVKESQLAAKRETMEKLHQEREKQLEAKGETMEKLHQEREKQLEAKERQLEEQAKELEVSKKQFGSQVKVKSEPLENAPAANNDANEQQGLVNYLQGLLEVVDQYEQETESPCAHVTTNKAPDNNISVAIEKAVSPGGVTLSSPNLQPTAKNNNIIVAPGRTKKRTRRQAPTIPPSAVNAIEKLIQQKKLVKAYGRIKKFKLFHKFPPEQVLKDYVDKGMKCMENSQRKKFLHEQDQVVIKGIYDLRRVIDCIKVHNLKSQYTTESIEKQIDVLQKFMEDRRNENQKKRLCSTVDPTFQQHEHKLQRTSFLADRPSGLHPDYPNHSFYNGQFSIPSNSPFGYGNPGFPQNPC